MEKIIKQKLINRGFKEETLLNNRGLIGACIDETEAITVTRCYTTFAGRQQEILEFAEYIAKEHYQLVNQIGKIHYWKNEENAKTTVQLYKDFKANDL